MIMQGNKEENKILHDDKEPMMPTDIEEPKIPSDEDKMEEREALDKTENHQEDEEQNDAHSVSDELFIWLK